ncbi:MAG: hypothetical protein DWQ09_13720 [Proteobacteria bacterium]|nr:MAG: hypothetical protein DWQ09_13720 [Pseudomonadota bacterium]QKK12428.1 MAG: hypothetical protein HND59_13410 [Pseudomonadota bacterium]
MGHRNTAATPQRPLRPGCTYSNGSFGGNWEVRRILAIEAPCDEQPAANITYQVVVGHHRRKKAHCTCIDFNQWARYRVERNETTWYRVEF